MSYPLMIDAYSHITPPKYLEYLRTISPKDCAGRIDTAPPLFDMDARFRIMDKYEGLVQAISLGPVIKEIHDPVQAVELARRANDEMAELIAKYPDRFVAGIASIPTIDMDAAMKELDRAIKCLKFRGLQLNSNEYGKPLDSPEFWPIYEKMAQYNLPIFIHPQREATFADYRTESASKYNLHNIFGWPYETTIAMGHFVFSGILEKYPNLKIVSHHGGGMVPYYEQRIVQHAAKIEMVNLSGYMEGDYMQGMTKTPIQYFKMFYADTAIHGNTPALMCAHKFFGSNHILFGADMPLGDRNFGIRSYRQTINAIEAMDITAAEKKAIFEDNVRDLMRLPV